MIPRCPFWEYKKYVSSISTKPSTISATGRVWFSAYKYGNGRGKYEICRKQQITIGKEIANEILALFSQYIQSEPVHDFATDIGDWKMTITNCEGKEYIFNGSLFGGVTVGDIDLTNYLREQIPISHLFVFDQFGF